MKPLPLILFLALAKCAAASVYYVDSGSGNDSNSGLSISAPWKHLPGDPSATGTPASATGITGTIYLKGGSVYALATSSGITLDSPGYSPGITIANGSEVGYGSGMPSIDGAGVGNWILFSYVSNARFRGLKMGNTVSSPAADASAVTFRNCVSNFLDSCIVHDIGTSSANAHADGVEIINDSQGASYHTVTNCTIYNSTQKCIETYRAGYNTIVNNFLWNARDHGIVLTSDGNRVFGNTISNAGVNVLMTTGTDPGYGIKFSIGSPLTTSDNLFYNNVIAHCHRGGIKLDNGQGGGVGDRNKIFNNTLIDIDSSGTYNAGISFDCRSAGVNGTLILNNIITSEAPVGAAGGITLPVGIYAPSGGSSLGNNNVIAYNLWWDPNTAIHPGLEIGGVDHNPTWFNFSDAGSASPDYRFKVSANGSGNSFSFSTQLFDTNPGFTAYPKDLTLQPTSPARAVGTNLSAWFTTDIRGVKRVAWSMGAYEAGGVVVPPVIYPPVIISGGNISGTNGATFFIYSIITSNTATTFGATNLPPGLTLDGSTGVITGVPTAAGIYSVGLFAANSAGSSFATSAFTIYPAVLPTLPAPPTDLGWSLVLIEHNTVSVSLDWVASSTAGVSYRVYSSGVLSQTVTGTSTTLFLRANTTFAFNVTAFNSDGESVSSGTLVLTTPKRNHR